MMISTRNRLTLLLGILCLGTVGIERGSAYGAASSARQQVRTGLNQHRAGQYEAAAASFAEAQQSLPGEARITYDRACALAAQGKREEAADLFRQSALAREPQLVASSHYNLGCLAADEAKALFGEQPEQADAATREQGLKLLHEAVLHYRDCLRVDGDHADARKNLELLRLWIKHMGDVWARRDREKRRDEMDLIEFLQWIDGQQRALEAATRTLDGERGRETYSAADLTNSNTSGRKRLATPSGTPHNSPRQRQAIAQTENAQRLLAEEIEPLKEKIEAALSGQQPADATTTQAVRTLQQTAQQAKSAMFRAADELAVRELTAASTGQAEAIDALNEIYRAVAPYEQILDRATNAEQGLVDTTDSLVSDESTDESLIDRKLAARDQGYIGGWSAALPARARQLLAQLEEGRITQPGVGPAADEQQQKQRQTQAALKESYEKAIELTPKIAELAADAASDLEEANWQAAHPKQQEALRLLKEIAPKTPPSDDNQQDQQQDQNEDQQGDNQDQQQPQGSQDQQQDQQQQEKSGDQQEQQKQDLSRQQAEALLSKARQREREHRERRKQQQRALQGTIRVDRDW